MNSLENKKQIIYIGAGILILGVLGFLAYNYFFGGTTVEPADQNVGVSGRLPQLDGNASEGALTGGPQELQNLKPGESFDVTPEQRIYRITDFPVVSPSLNKTGDKLLFYKKSGGDLISSDFSGGTQEKISNITIVGLMEALWSPARDRSAAFYIDGETKKGFLHNVADYSVAVLPQNIKSFSWSPDGKSIAYLVRNGDELELILADASGKNPRVIFRTPILDSVIKWITADKIAFGQSPSGLSEGFIFQYSRSSGTFSKVLGSLYGLSAIWYPNGTKMLESHTSFNGKRPLVSLRDNSGKEILSLGVATISEKCEFADQNTAYCAVPSYILPQWTLPDEYYRGETRTSDALIFIDANKKTAVNVLPEMNFDMANLVIASDKTMLFFVNKTDGTLWGIKLK